MKRLFKNEKGYTLLLSFAIIIIFSILGMSLLTITTNGATKNKTRENVVQATDLADKGIDYSIKDIQTHLEKGVLAGNGGKGLSKDQFQTLMNNTLHKINCPKTINIGENDKTKVCIDNIQMVSTDEKDLYKRIITLKSTGVSNNKEFTTYTDLVVGTDAVPDQLRYAVSTNREGDLYLYGGVEIHGDLKTAGNLYINKNAFWGTNLWERSVAAKIIKNDKSVYPKIIMTNNKKNNIYYYEYYNTSMYAESYKNLSSQRPKNAVNINSNTAQSTVASFLTDTDYISLVQKDSLEDYYDVKTAVDNIVNNFVTNYNRSSYKWLNRTVTNENFGTNKNNIYIVTGENRTYNSTKPSNNSANLNISGNTQLRGQYYVNGNVNITNATLKSDAIIYAKGDVTIKYSTLQGINDQSTLIVFANGNIQLANISDTQDTPSEIKGFFYSNSDMLIYGVGSNIKIYGGIAGKRIDLTALRGKSYGNSKLTIDSVYDQPKKLSRLTIIYDENLINNYTTFKRDEEDEYIKSVNPPEILKRY